MTKLREVVSESVRVDEMCETDLLNNLYPVLQKYCHFLSQNSWDGDDLAQNTIVKVMESYKLGPTINQSLLKRIAYNHWIDTVRKRKKEVLEALPEPKEDNNHSTPESFMNTIDFLMERLTPKQLIIYILKEAYHFQAKEISEILDSTETAIKSSLFRAKKQLEKTKHETDLNVDDLYWSEDHQQWLSTLIYQSFSLQDPSILIKSIPSLISSLSGATATPMLIFNHKKSRQLHSPVNSFSMAA